MGKESKHPMEKWVRRHKQSNLHMPECKLVQPFAIWQHLTKLHMHLPFDTNSIFKNLHDDIPLVIQKYTEAEA